MKQTLLCLWQRYGLVVLILSLCLTLVVGVSLKVKSEINRSESISDIRKQRSPSRCLNETIPLLNPIPEVWALEMMCTNARHKVIVIQGKNANRPYLVCKCDDK